MDNTKPLESDTPTTGQTKQRLRELDPTQLDRAMAWIWTYMGALFGADRWNRHAPDSVRPVWAQVLGRFTGEDIKRGLEATRAGGEAHPPGAGLFAARCRSWQPGTFAGGAAVLSKPKAVEAFNRLLTAGPGSSEVASQHIAMCRRILAGETTRTLEAAQAQGRDYADMTVEEARANCARYAKEADEAHYRQMREDNPGTWQDHPERCTCLRCERRKGFRA